MSSTFISDAYLYSGVLSASIDLSRQRWTSEGVFERYWEKPSKKKPVTAMSNPAKETMSRLGACTMIIEPHAFDITLYTVKDLHSAPKPPVNHHPTPSHYSSFHQPPSYQAPVYNGPFTGTHDSNGPSSTAPIGHKALPSFGEGFGRLEPQVAPSSYHEPPPTLPSSIHPGPPLAMTRSSSSGRTSSPTKNPQSDPVIQILATRAASDHALKSLMKVVASGQASPTQLREFQSHIDEINSSLQKGKDLERRASEVSQAPPPARETIPQASVEYDDHNHEPAVKRPDLPTTAPAPDPTNVPIKIEPIHTHYYPTAPPPRPKPYHPPPSKPEVHSIVFDFGGTGDRFSFPRYSILDYIIGGTEVIVSFLVTRRGSFSRVKRYKDNRNYYQPVSMRLTAQNARTLEPLSRIVAPRDEVRKYMEGIFDKMAPAELVYLATRLPRSEGGEDSEAEEELGSNQIVDKEAIQPFYEAPNWLAPMVT